VKPAVLAMGGFAEPPIKEKDRILDKSLKGEQGRASHERANDPKGKPALYYGREERPSNLQGEGADQ